MQALCVKYSVDTYYDSEQEIRRIHRAGREQLGGLNARLASMYQDTGRLVASSLSVAILILRQTVSYVQSMRSEGVGEP